MTALVKICGITSVEQARHALGCGADALGLVLFSGSPRFVDMDTAAEIRAVIAAPALCVTLLVNAGEEFVREVIQKLNPDLLQFHGDESPEFCEQFNHPYIRAIRMRDGLDIGAEAARYPSARAILCDAWHPQKYGGTGQQFDWSLLPDGRSFSLVLAGGLEPDNVAEAVSAVKPCAVDVSGGVEASPGHKSPEKVERFIHAAKGL